MNERMQTKSQKYTLDTKYPIHTSEENKKGQNLSARVRERVHQLSYGYI